MSSLVQNRATIVVVEFTELHADWQRSAFSLYEQISTTGKSQNQFNKLLDGFEEPAKLIATGESYKDFMSRINPKSTFFSFIIKRYIYTRTVCLT